MKMNPEELDEIENLYLAMCKHDDSAGASRLLTQYPELGKNEHWQQAMLKLHVFEGKVDFVRIILDTGVNVNISESGLGKGRVLFDAVSGGSAEVVRLLLERGAEPNWDWGDGRLYCVPLSLAIEQGQFDIVQMLVEAGAALDVVDNQGQTPLSRAAASGRQHIIDYLHTRGAVLPQQTLGYVAPPPAPPTDPLEDYVAWNTCGIWDKTFAQDGAIQIRIAWANNDGDSQVLFTLGMSNHTMQVPAGGEEFQHAELALYLRIYPASEDPADWCQPELSWYVDWLQKIACWPKDNNTWLGGKWTIISNEDPPQPLSEFTDMTCWLLLGEKEPLSRVELPDGRSVCFYTLMPIHTAERDLALTEGLVALLEKFADQDVPLWLDPHRKSVV
jgi:hypothetical protein